MELPEISEIIDYANQEMATLWPEYTRLVNPDIMEVNLSCRLQELKKEIIARELADKHHLT